MDLDVQFVRSNFPALTALEADGQAFLENAGGSLSCRHTIDALHRYYSETKVQPYAPYRQALQAGEAMDRSRARWAEALGVTADDVHFGPSTSSNTYVLSQAIGATLGPGDEVVVTNQDHEANTGSMRRAVEAAGAVLREWRVEPTTGLLSIERLDGLVNSRTRWVALPHSSNIVGQENPVASITAIAHAAGARVVVDGVSYVPHGIPDVGELDVDVYLFSLYKVYSVHQGVMVTRRGVLDELPNQGHYFNSATPTARLTPAGPDHAQIAAAGAVLDYLAESHIHHGGSPTDDLRSAARQMSELWQARETTTLAPVLDLLGSAPNARLLGPREIGAAHRCPTVAFLPLSKPPAQLAEELVEHGIMTDAHNFYARRLIEALDIDADAGVVRVSWVHYTSDAEIDQLLQALDAVLR